jgi:hypothetical protein
LITKTVSTIRYILYTILGLTIVTVIGFFFLKDVIDEDVIEGIGEITGALLVLLLIVQLLPFIAREILKRPTLSPKTRCWLEKVFLVLKPLHFVISYLFIGIVVLHLISNLCFDSFEWDMEVVTGIIYGLLVIITAIYGFLNKLKSNIYLIQHRFWAIIMFIFLIIHLID